jgi:hypothetical protein
MRKLIVVLLQFGQRSPSGDHPDLAETPSMNP